MISTLPPKRAGKWLTGLAILGLTVVGCGGNDTATTDTGEETSAGECGACTPLHPPAGCGSIPPGQKSMGLRLGRLIARCLTTLS
jgi:hypothetical protein